jgi:hypothetical protein
MGLICCPDSSVRNYHYSLRNSPEERSSHQFCGGILKSLICNNFIHHPAIKFNSIFRGFYGLGMFENRMLKKIFEPKKDEVAKEWRKLCNEKLNFRYCS